MQLWNSRFGSKGFILSLDAAVAVFIVSIILTISAYKISQVDEPNIQIMSVADDITATLDYEGTLDTLNKGIIENKLTSLLPVNLDMKINIDCGDKKLETFSMLPNKKNIISGKRAIVTNNLEYCTVRYWAWLK